LNHPGTHSGRMRVNLSLRVHNTKHVSVKDAGKNRADLIPRQEVH